jgi:hypothetical protein
VPFCALDTDEKMKTNTKMPSSEQNLEECDARHGDSSTAAGFIMNKNTFEILVSVLNDKI